MSVSPINNRPVPVPEPIPLYSRSGHSWSSLEHETIASGAAAGHTLEEIARELGRKPEAVLQRSRRMLPVDERKSPPELVMARLSELLAADPDYDWRHTMLKDPPPAPINKPPDVVHTGIPGLTDEQLLVVAYAVLVADHQDPDDSPAAREIVQAACDRRLNGPLGRLRIAALRRIGYIDPQHEHEYAHNWLEAHRLWPDGQDGYRRRRYGGDPWHAGW